MEKVDQQQVNKSIELLMHKLSSKGDKTKFEKIIQQNVDTKRLSATTEIDFYDRLMLNITFFVENKKVWDKLLRELFTVDVLPKPVSIETKTLQEQMVIRETISRQMEDYTEIFHKQYEQLNVTSEDVIYDYAYASVEHGLRFDFLNYLLFQPNAKDFFTGDCDETMRIIDGYVAYYADQMVNQMELK